jgi:MIP family channel proteins
MRKYLCEFLGTCVLVLFGCGVAVFTNNLLAIALAFGLSIIAVAYTIGKISGCHVNPAVSFAMWIDKRITTKDFIGYSIAQVLGAIAGSALLMLIINSTTLGDIETVGLGANAFGSLAGSEITMLGALIVEIVLTFVFVLAVLGVTRDEKKSSVAPIVIGLALVLVHLFGINLTGTSVNPARSFGPSLLLGGEHLEQVWVFIVGPLVGAAFASLAIFFIDLEEEKLVIESAISTSKEEKLVVSEPKKAEIKVTKKETKAKPKTSKTTGKKPTKKLA